MRSVWGRLQRSRSQCEGPTVRDAMPTLFLAVKTMRYNTYRYYITVFFQSRYNEVQYILYHCISVRIQWIQLRIYSPWSRYGGYVSYM